MPADLPSGQDMIFLVGGFDENAAYGRVFEIIIPTSPKPRELHGNEGEFGPVWGGQRELVDRLLQGFDSPRKNCSAHALQLNVENKDKLKEALGQLALAIPYQFLPLQDSVDLCTFLIRMTISAQKWQVILRAVGGEVDVATITKTDGYRPVRLKRITSETQGD